MKKLNLEKVIRLNRAFKTNSFRMNMEDMDYFTVIKSINSRTIAPERNNLKIISEKGVRLDNIKEIVGEINKDNSDLLSISVIDKNNLVLHKFDLIVSGMFSDNNLKVNNRKVNFKHLPGTDAYVSKYLGFIIL